MTSPDAKTNPRKHGDPPYAVVAVHGGPGAAGEMAPVARALGSIRGILEPFQTAATVDGQVEELRAVIEKHATAPVTLIGFSWGAWLGFIFTALVPGYVRKLILIGSGPFEERYASAVQATRLSRLSLAERAEIERLAGMLGNPAAKIEEEAFKRFGVLFSKADTYDPLVDESDEVDLRLDIFRSVWTEAAELRRSTELLGLGKRITCPVVAIHGDYDPHPADGVREPLSAAIEGFRFFMLDKCGHKPWIERCARAEFYRILEQEVQPT